MADVDAAVRREQLKALVQRYGIIDDKAIAKQRYAEFRAQYNFNLLETEFKEVFNKLGFVGMKDDADDEEKGDAGDSDGDDDNIITSWASDLAGELVQWAHIAKFEAPLVEEAWNEDIRGEGSEYFVHIDKLVRGMDSIDVETAVENLNTELRPEEERRLVKEGQESVASGAGSDWKETERKKATTKNRKFRDTMHAQLTADGGLVDLQPLPWNSQMLLFATPRARVMLRQWFATLLKKTPPFQGAPGGGETAFDLDRVFNILRNDKSAMQAFKGVRTRLRFMENFLQSLQYHFTQEALNHVTRAYMNKKKETGFEFTTTKFMVMGSPGCFATSLFVRLAEQFVHTAVSHTYNNTKTIPREMKAVLKKDAELFQAREARKEQWKWVDKYTRRVARLTNKLTYAENATKRNEQHIQDLRQSLEEAKRDLENEKVEKVKVGLRVQALSKEVEKMARDVATKKPRAVYVRRQEGARSWNLRRSVEVWTSPTFSTTDSTVPSQFVEWNRLLKDGDDKLRVVGIMQPPQEEFLSLHPVAQRVMRLQPVTELHHDQERLRLLTDHRVMMLEAWWKDAWKGFFNTITKLHGEEYKAWLKDTAWETVEAPLRDKKSVAQELQAELCTLFKACYTKQQNKCQKKKTMEEKEVCRQGLPDKVYKTCLKAFRKWTQDEAVLEKLQHIHVESLDDTHREPEFLQEPALFAFLRRWSTTMFMTSLHPYDRLYTTAFLETMDVQQRQIAAHAPTMKIQFTKMELGNQQLRWLQEHPSEMPWPVFRYLNNLSETARAALQSRMEKKEGKETYLNEYASVVSQIKGYPSIAKSAEVLCGTFLEWLRQFELYQREQKHLTYDEKKRHLYELEELRGHHLMHPCGTTMYAFMEYEHNKSSSPKPDVELDGWDSSSSEEEEEGDVKVDIEPAGLEYHPVTPDEEKKIDAWRNADTETLSTLETEQWDLMVKNATFGGQVEDTVEIQELIQEMQADTKDRVQTSKSYQRIIADIVETIQDIDERLLTTYKLDILKEQKFAGVLESERLTSTLLEEKLKALEGRLAEEVGNTNAMSLVRLVSKGPTGYTYDTLIAALEDYVRKKRTKTKKKKQKMVRSKVILEAYQAAWVMPNEQVDDDHRKKFIRQHVIDQVVSVYHTKREQHIERKMGERLYNRHPSGLSWTEYRKFDPKNTGEFRDSLFRQRMGVFKTNAEVDAEVEAEVNNEVEELVRRCASYYSLDTAAKLAFVKEVDEANAQEKKVFPFIHPCGAPLQVFLFMCQHGVPVATLRKEEAKELGKKLLEMYAFERFFASSVDAAVEQWVTNGARWLEKPQHRGLYEERARDAFQRRWRMVMEEENQHAQNRAQNEKIRAEIAHKQHVQSVVKDLRKIIESSQMKISRIKNVEIQIMTRKCKAANVKMEGFNNTLALLRQQEVARGNEVMVINPYNSTTKEVQNVILPIPTKALEMLKDESIIKWQVGTYQALQRQVAELKRNFYTVLRRGNRDVANLRQELPAHKQQDFQNVVSSDTAITTERKLDALARVVESFRSVNIKELKNAVLAYCTNSVGEFQKDLQRMGQRDLQSSWKMKASGTNIVENHLTTLVKLGFMKEAKEMREVVVETLQGVDKKMAF